MATERTLEDAHLEIAVLKTELANAKTALDKAERSLAVRLDELNHTRRDFITRDAFEKVVDTLNLRLGLHDEWRSRITGVAATAEWMRMALFALIAAVLAALAYFK